MSRNDLLVSLVKASSSGDRQAVREVTEELIADVRSKQHNVLADRLVRALHSSHPATSKSIDSISLKGKEYIQERIPRRKLDELVLPESCFSAIYQYIEEQHRSDILRAHSLQPRHKILLVGPPGNGKTTLAEAIAESLAVPYFIVRYDAIIGSFLGETATRLKRVFDYARTSPCVLFFDEFDAVGKERGDLHETGEIKRVVTSLLMQIDDLPSYTTIIAATNHQELLDRAAWRRFELRISIPQPTRTDLSKFIRQFFYFHEPDVSIDAAGIAKRLGDVSFAEAEQFCLNVRRRQVLSMGGLTLPESIRQSLLEWKEIVGEGTIKSSVKRGEALPADTSL